jgi:hypothetical protein
MIVRGPKRRSLTWAGCAGQLAFGGLLLPPGAGRAAPPAKQETRKVIVIGGNGGVQIVLDADDSPEEKALKLLKQARKILAAQQQAQPGGNAKRPNPEKVRQAREQVNTLARQLAQQRRTLQRTEARFRQAQARLAQLEGKPAVRINIPLQMQFRIHTEQGAPKPKAPDTKGKAIVVPKQLLLRLQDGKIIGLPANKGKPDQFQDLQTRLDRLLREVEALRRDVKRATQPRK